MIRFAYNFTASEAGWFACVLGAANDMPWIGPVVVLALVLVHLRLVDTPPVEEVRLMLAAVFIGLLADSFLVASGLVSYPNGTWIDGLAPYWILAMWAMFATTMNMSLKWLKSRLPLAALLGAIFGPLAYLAGEELGAVTFESRTLALVALSLIWAFCMPLLLYLASHWGGVSRARRPSYIYDDWRVKSNA